MVVRNYGEQAIIEQAVDFLIDAEYSNILKEADVNRARRARSNRSTRSSRPNFTFRVPLAPKWTWATSTRFACRTSGRLPMKPDVDKAIEDLRQMYATTENVEREAQEGDYVLVDVKSETPN
jgi:FKBP-type peptidyl-prolyl cis-trans isomerase (trigger factor)